MGDFSGAMNMEVIRCEEWQCRYVFPDGRCCRRTLKHKGEQILERCENAGHAMRWEIRHRLNGMTELIGWCA
jgi:RNase P subunit RPR2